MVALATRNLRDYSMYKETVCGNQQNIPENTLKEYASGLISAIQTKHTKNHRFPREAEWKFACSQGKYLADRIEEQINKRISYMSMKNL